MPSSWIISEPYAGMQSQALGLAEAAGLAPEMRPIAVRPFWRRVPALLWPRPLAAVTPDLRGATLPDIVVGCGSKGGEVLAALPRATRRVMVQRHRLAPSRFDLVMAPAHDELSGPNVIVTRTALHRVTQARLAEAAIAWGPRLAHLPRPLVAVLVGGSNGRWRLDEAVAARLAGQLAEMMRRDRVGLAVTPSRRTAPAVASIFGRTLRPLGAEVWDFTGENPYFGMLALADAIVVTNDSVSMMSEAVATAAPVLLAMLPGRSHRQGLFVRGLVEAGRARTYDGRFETWLTAPLDDTAAAAAEMRRRLGF